jgi:hypothetical protein
LRVAVVAVLSLALIGVAGPAAAKKLSGSKKSETLVGTKGADKIKGKGGNDKLKGKGGKDSLNGGKGRDQIIGGGGADRHVGGAGNDTLKTADGRKDKVINAGSGSNTCIIDTALELSIVKGCTTIKGGTGPGSEPGANELRVITYVGTLCESGLPICPYAITGEGADGPVGTVTGTGGVTTAGGAVSIQGTEWNAAGLYGCTADGTLHVAIGTKSTDIPIDCP